MEQQKYYKATVIKTFRYWHKNKHTDQWNKTKSLEINPHTWDQSMVNKGGKNVQTTVSSLSVAGKAGQPHVDHWS